MIPFFSVPITHGLWNKQPKKQKKKAMLTRFETHEQVTHRCKVPIVWLIVAMHTAFMGTLPHNETMCAHEQWSINFSSSANTPWNSRQYVSTSQLDMSM
jgi:hypothetical protein